MRAPFCFFLLFSLSASSSSLFEDLDRVEKVNKEIATKPPITYNYNLSGGYFNMPSARSPDQGSMGIGFSAVPPYRNYNISVQLHERVEVTANYHIMLGIPDLILGEDFGDWSDRSLNYKLTFLKPEDSDYKFPGIALGMDDFFGSKNFHDEYAVITQVVPDLGLEASLGIARGRIRGFFGGLSVSPFYRYTNPFLKGIVLSAEYDAINYAEDPTSALGREYKTRINAGIHYIIGDIFHITLSSLRGKKLAGSFSINYNLGQNPPLFPKFLDPPLYSGPKNHEPVGALRPNYTLASEIAHAFKSQSLQVYDISINQMRERKKELRIALINPSYRDDSALKKRIARVLSNIAPQNIDTVMVSIEEEALPIYQTTFRTEDLVLYRDEKIGDVELAVLAPQKNIRKKSLRTNQIYKKNPSRISFVFRPRTRLFFGNSAGKVKFDVSLSGGPQGYIYNQMFYDISASYKLFDGFENVRPVDKMNPSQMINVRSDTISYYKNKIGALDRAYIQKSWSLQNGWFARLAGGYFEIAYGGVAGEALYQRAGACWAIGLEGALVAKRKYSGLAFTRKIRKLNGFTPTYKTNFLGSQYFLDLYLKEPWLGIDAKIQIGQFLARDAGVRIDARRVFKSGANVGYWVGFTSARDVVNGSRFFDQGVSLSVPLDLFMPKSSRRNIGTAMSFWLRDSAAVSDTGRQLYGIIHGD